MKFRMRTPPRFRRRKHFHTQEAAETWLFKFYGGRTWPKNPEYQAKYADDYPWRAHVWM